MRYKKIILYFYRLILCLFLVCFFAWLFNKNIIPQGHLFLSKDFCSKSSFVSNLYPENRVGEIEIDENSNCWQKIFVEPVYFKTKIPRTFTRASVKISYSNPDQAIFQVGLMKKRINPLDWNFKLKLIENKIFDELDWHKLTRENVTLWQKEKKFNTIHEYVNNVPDDQKTVTFYYQFDEQAIKDKTKVVGWNRKTPLEYVDYIIAKYEPPQVMGEWKEKTIEFLVGPDYMNNHALEFIISSPGLTVNRNEIKINKIEINLYRKNSNFKIFIEDIVFYLSKKIAKIIN
ncbi:hypothetical protein ISS06_00290 [Patescibacteria group bacterium]|nr:hypothetical protein [Patescibacteria group bacterium]